MARVQLLSRSRRCAARCRCRRCRCCAGSPGEQALVASLQQPAFWDEAGKAACRLVCVSKRLRSIMADDGCESALVAHVEVRRPQQASALLAWLPQHGTLLGGLELDLPFSTEACFASVGAGEEDYDRWMQGAADLAIHSERLLEALPLSLVWLVLDGFGTGESGDRGDNLCRPQAASLAHCGG